MTKITTYKSKLLNVRDENTRFKQKIYEKILLTTE